MPASTVRTGSRPVSTTAPQRSSGWPRNAAELGVSTIVVSGESGGGNLTLATALKAKQDGRARPDRRRLRPVPVHLQRVRPETSGSGLALRERRVCHRLSTGGRAGEGVRPDGANAAQPRSPGRYHAQPVDLEGLPPHVISVNQLDPLRDEGLAYFRKLLDAGVSAVGRTVNGTCHAGDCLFRGAMPDVYRATIRDIKGFADSL